MKIIEKKCPNCGADLEFKIDDKEAKCKYCNSEFIIENNNVNSNKINASDITLKYVKTFTKIHFAVTIIASIIIFVIFIIVGVNIFNFHKNGFDSFFGDDTDNTPAIFNKSKEIKISTDDVTSEMREELLEASLEEIESWKGYQTSYEKSNSEEFGFYYLKNSVSIEIVYVLKTTYSDGTDSKDIYTAIQFFGNSLDTLSYNPYISTELCHLNDTEYAYGFESLEALYNKVVKSKKNLNYKIVATDNLYIK